jgi:DNA-binding LacI/PurR family transcriptional regulator
VTAIAAFNDEVALRAMSALRDLGLAVPADMAVIGFDDNDMGALVTPALTSLHIDADVHGRRAARGVLGLDTSGLSPEPGRIVERESV